MAEAFPGLASYKERIFIVLILIEKYLLPRAKKIIFAGRKQSSVHGVFIQILCMHLKATPLGVAKSLIPSNALFFYRKILDFQFFNL